MKRVKDFGNGVRKIGRKFFVSVGSDERITSEQQRIMLREQDTFANALIYTIVVNRAVYAPYDTPREFEPPRCDVYG